MKEEDAKTSNLGTLLSYIIGTTGFAMIMYHIWYILSLPYEPQIHSILHLGFAFVILIVSRLRQNWRWDYLAMLLAAVWVTYYFVYNYEEILSNPSYPPMICLITGIIAAIIVFILTVEIFGPVFPALTAIGVLYMAFGSYLPRWIGAPQCDWDRLVTLLSADVTSPWGVYGKLLILSANYLFLFILFGSALEAFGGLRFVMSLGMLAASKFRSGAAALSVFTSALVGSVTGSTVANITITGSFTIPMMKKGGFVPEQAAAIETAASSGGQILPPIMGATVFLMAGFTGIPYISVAKACFIPALMYFAVLLLYAELTARKLNITPIPVQKIDKREMLLDAPVFIVPLALLMILLIVGFSLMRTIFWCLLCISMLGIINSLRPEARLNLKEVGKKLTAGIISGSQIAVVLALIGVLVATVEVTGLGMRLGNILVALGEHHLLLLLLLTAVTGMILGVGLPTPAAYIICATLLSPAIIKLGVPLLQAHLFPLYYAVFSHLTPPVGIGLMVACKMAESDYLRSAVEAIKAAFSSFLFPFLFVYTPAILLQFDGLNSAVRQFLGVSLGFLSLSLVLNPFWKTKMNTTQRLIQLTSMAFIMISIFGTRDYLFLFIGGALLMWGLLLNIRSSRTETLLQI
ncbi:MAG: TRAP transporter fused permease subunit [Deltaproteobacteria bacterium]|nr:TRAP transporter fused permease subunit [Deltaproteobacteria bacterium]MBW1994367.1 TRAP transporter fused permease subunit [Deltaproteobacteria bacterium]MBW2154224.1 TRAP transporter fused permease subunit [Deltaproteobacteria bacterium]